MTKVVDTGSSFLINMSNRLLTIKVVDAEREDLVNAVQEAGARECLQAVAR